jgi:hypothetical protein
MKIIAEHIVMLEKGKSCTMERVIVVDAIERTAYFVKGETNDYHREICETEFNEANKRLYDWLFPKWWLRKYKRKSPFL